MNEFMGGLMLLESKLMAPGRLHGGDLQDPEL